MIKLRPSVFVMPMVTTLDPAPTADNIVEWVTRRIREIEDRYTGEIDDQSTVYRIREEMEQVALVVQQVTGEKPPWSATIQSHTTYSFSNHPPRMAAPVSQAVLGSEDDE